MATANESEAPKLEKEDSLIQSDYIASKLTKNPALSSVFGKGSPLASNWMGALTNELTLNEIIMLGSHDSGAFKGEHQYQDISIRDQLKFGVRLLDFQLASHKNDVWLYYGEACMLLGDATMEIEAFLGSNPNEKVTVVLRNSKTAPDPVKWVDVKTMFELGFKSKLVPKEDSGAKLRQMKGSVILIAPKELEMAENWGEDSMIHHSAPEDTNTILGLHDYLLTLSLGDLEVKSPKLVWLECRSRDVASKRRSSELQEVQSPSFFGSSEQIYFNVISFSFINKGHYALVKDYFVKFNKK
ncbi:Phosphatidylinositol diacylglycerol-lyase [Oopsacas minuta]|uniref:Phosphatidylinositol diacylglycerol-lyase n=1 Tax=Oopsacas minuta TaxID=111878 RepID=A0AAV7JZX5_9METZ|nr:Phosphatidylinositol diacylglycerol-lyase [Oopsacas minuta]